MPELCGGHCLREPLQVRGQHDHNPPKVENSAPLSVSPARTRISPPNSCVAPPKISPVLMIAGSTAPDTHSALTMLFINVAAANAI